MSYKRQINPLKIKSGLELTADLIGIGFMLSGKSAPNPNIEDSLLSAAKEGMAGDFRTLSLLVNWLEIHLPYVNADRMNRILQQENEERLKAFWIAIAQRFKTDRRFASLARKMRGRQIDLIESKSSYLLQTKGCDPRFEKTCLRVPAGLLRHRPKDILSPNELAKHHIGYRYRIIMGPSYRADMWAQIELQPNLSTAELARVCYGSFATAWKVIQDKKLVAA